ncbi:MAG TPA: heat shock protein Hsp18 [Clostridiaceae bacterium]|jgi:HSP20 family protein|nr:heat shock protein Hsp18 [Clostridiaceae bacterium]
MFDMVPFKKNRLLKKGEDFFDNFFDEDFTMPMPFDKMGLGFKVDLKETDTSYLVEADLPGIAKEDVDIDYKNNYLTIKAKREEKVEEKKENYVRKERKYGEFKRMFYVDNVDENSIKASFTDGVLKVELPKTEKAKTETKRIVIE